MHPSIELYTGIITPQIMDLLLTADPDRELIDSYLANSTKFVATKAVITGIIVIEQNQDQFEIKNLAVHKNHRGNGIAKSLISASKQYAKDQGAKFLHVSTGNSSLTPLALYQKCGFRIAAIEHDYFKRYQKPIYENGIACIDRVTLRVDLNCTN